LANLIYSVLESLDGFIEDDAGNFDWAGPDEEVHSFINDLERTVGTHLYGRRMYEVMSYWEVTDFADQPAYVQDYAEIWRPVDKIVYSRTLDAVTTARTRLEQDFDPDAVRELKATVERDLTVSGPELASHAFRAGLVDELHLFLAPIVVGGGKRSLPDDVRIELDLLDERRFGNGMVHLHYATRT
jgi:dihydrofolate reductase